MQYELSVSLSTIVITLSSLLELLLLFQQSLLGSPLLLSSPFFFKLFLAFPLLSLFNQLLSLGGALLPNAEHTNTCEYASARICSIFIRKQPVLKCKMISDHARTSPPSACAIAASPLAWRLILSHASLGLAETLTPDYVGAALSGCDPPHAEQWQLQHPRRRIHEGILYENAE